MTFPVFAGPYQFLKKAVSEAYDDLVTWANDMLKSLVKVHIFYTLVKNHSSKRWRLGFSPRS